MIVVKDADFEMEQIKELPFFNLKMPVKVNEGKSNERSDLKIVAYGIPFHMCIKEIVSYKLNKDNEDKVYSINEYLSTYKKLVEELSPLIQFIDPPKKKTKTTDDEDIDDELTDDENN